MSILSIQSSVAYGHVGNSAALPALHRLGFEVWPLSTVELSNHPGHASCHGGPRDPAKVADIIAGIAALGVLHRCRALLGGYLGPAAMGPVVLDALDRVRAANPEALYACDPVLGDDDTGLYVAPEVAAFIRDRLVPRADIVTPNHFELEFLAGRRCTGLAEVLDAIAVLRAMGPGLVVGTTLAVDDAADTVTTLAVDGAGAWRVTTPLVDTAVHGTGDTLAALFLGHRLRGAGVGAALAGAVSGLYAVLETTRDLARDELALIAAQDALIAPPHLFTAERLG